MRVVDTLSGKGGPQRLKHLHPALGGILPQNGCIKRQSRPHADGGDLFQQWRIIRGGLVFLHQCIDCVEKFHRGHGKYLVDGDKLIFRGIGSLGSGVGAALDIGGQGKQLHLLLNGIHVGQILCSGKHRPDNGPNRGGGHIHPGNTLGQRPLPIRRGNGINARLVKHGGGIGPGIQQLHIAEPVRLRMDIDHRLRPQIHPGLGVNGVHIGGDHRAEGGIRQLFHMVELIDRCPPGQTSVGVGGQRLGGIGECQGEGVDVCLANQLPHLVRIQRLLRSAAETGPAGKQKHQGQ